MPEVLTPEEVEARLAALADLGSSPPPGQALGVGREVPSTSRSPLSVIRTLPDVSESLIDSLLVEDGIGLGLAEIDVLTRGFRPTDLVMVTGFTSTGKTQLVNTMILNNPEKRVLFFSLDDPAEMILAKLVAMRSGYPAEYIEKWVRAGDDDTLEMVRETAEKGFPNLFVVDEPVSIRAMDGLIQEATERWGAPPQAVVVDYLEMIQGGGSDQFGNVRAKAQDLKAMSKTASWPTIVLHQGSRTHAQPGKPITIRSVAFGGEQEATILIGTRRKRDDQDLESWERDQHQDTVTVHVVKNKRPGGRVTHFEGVDLHLDPRTGFIRPLRGYSQPEDDTLGDWDERQRRLDL